MAELSYMPVNADKISAEINAQALVTDFKEALSSVRLKRSKAITDKIALKDELLKILAQRQSLIATILTNAHEQFPETIGLNLKQIKAELGANHPIFSVFKSDFIALKKLNGDIISRSALYSSAIKKVEDLEAEEFKIVDLYKHNRDLSPIEIPEAQVISSEIINVPDSDVASDLEMLNEISSLEMEATLENASDATVVSQAGDALNKVVTAQSESKLNLWMIGGVLAAFYILFGG